MGTPIFIVNATDPDQGAGGSVLYSFQPPSNFFVIDSGRGIVSVIRALDYEINQAYQLQVNATVSMMFHVSFVLFKTKNLICRTICRYKHWVGKYLEIGGVQGGQVLGLLLLIVVFILYLVFC